MEILIKVDDNINDFKNGDVLVFNFKTKKFSTQNINEIVDKKLENFTKEKNELKNELEAQKKRYKHEIERFGKLVDDLKITLSGREIV